LIITRFAACGNSPLFKIKGNSKSMNVFSFLFVMLYRLSWRYIQLKIDCDISVIASVLQSHMVSSGKRRGAGGGDEDSDED
jgi:hypothetical protein